MPESPLVQPPPRPHPDAAVQLSRPAPAITVVLPVHNQGATIAARYAELTAVLAGRSYEILAVDDGSTDASFAVLRDLAARDPCLRVVRLRRGFGRTAALAAGFDRARGAVVVTLDAEGRTDPADIPRLLHYLDQGYDVVSGRRDVPRALPTRVGNYLISIATGVRLHDYGCPLKAYRAEVIKEMHLYGDLYRFIPAIASWHGVRIAEVEVHERAGHGVRPGAGLWRVLSVLLDLITVRFLLHYAVRPMHSFGMLGGAMLLISGLLGSYLAIVKFVGGEDIGSRPLLLLALLLALVGIQLLVLGLLAELIVRVYYEVQRKPTYAVREVVEIAAPPSAAVPSPQEGAEAEA